MPVVSLKVSERTKELMKLHEEINWSAVARASIKKKLSEIEEASIDTERALKALQYAKRIQKKHKTKHMEKTAEELVREWRDKRL